MTADINIHRPPHLVASALIRAIEGYLWQDGVGVSFGEVGHALIQNFVDQYNREIERYYDEAMKLDIENQRLQKLCGQAASRLGSSITNRQIPANASLPKLIDELQQVSGGQNNE